MSGEKFLAFKDALRSARVVQGNTHGDRGSSIACIYLLLLP